MFGIRSQSEKTPHEEQPEAAAEAETPQGPSPAGTDTAEAPRPAAPGDLLGARVEVVTADGETRIGTVADDFGDLTASRTEVHIDQERSAVAHRYAVLLDDGRLAFADEVTPLSATH